MTANGRRAEEGWLRKGWHGGAERLSSPGGVSRRKTGQRSRERPKQGFISPGDFSELHQRTSGKRKQHLRAFSRVCEGEAVC